MMQEPFGITAWKKTPISVFERFPYVCPEPVFGKTDRDFWHNEVAAQQWRCLTW